jgi:quercetin dioxygenase-like cupin family protein
MSNPRTDRPQPVILNHYNLGEQLARLRAEEPLQKHGRDALTLVRDSGMNLVLTVLKSGARLNEHKAPGPISVLVLEGRITFSADGQRLDLGPHGLVTLPARVPHEVEALEDSAILITIASPVAHHDERGLKLEAEARFQISLPKSSGV